MKRILIISYDFPPCRAPGAAVRIAKFVKYLPEFGWQPTVICCSEPGFDVEPKTDNVLRIPRGFPEKLSSQLSAWSWAFYLRLIAPQRLRGQSFDLVFVSCPPFPYSLSALHIRKLFGAPLVVDFRDAWSLDPSISGNVIKRWFKRLLCQHMYPRLEKQLLRSAELFLTNTESMRRNYAQLLAGEKIRIILLPNGYDESDFAEPVELPIRNRLQFMYCGRFTEVGGRSPDLLLQGLRALINEGIPADLRIIGDTSKSLRKRIIYFGLQGNVTLCPTVPHRQAIHELRGADVLVLYQEPSHSPITAIAGKTFEYLRSGRPILAIVPPGDNCDLLRRYSPTSTILTTHNPKAVADSMRDLHARWTAGKLQNNVAPINKFAERFNRRNLTQKLAALIDEIVADRSGT